MSRQRQRYDSVASCSAGSDAPDYRDVWQDFAGNGRDSDLDDAPPTLNGPSSSVGNLYSGLSTAYNVHPFLYCPRYGWKYYDGHVCLLVCLFVCLLHCSLTYMYLKNNMSWYSLIFCTCYLWPWLDAPATTVKYVMYFRFMDDVMVLHCRSSGPESKTTLCFVEGARWRHEANYVILDKDWLSSTAAYWNRTV